MAALMALAAIFFVSCNKDKVSVPLSVTPDKAEFDVNGGNRTVSVECGGDWTVTGTCEWCSLSEREGNGSAKVVLSCMPNAMYEARSFEFTFACGDETASVTVQQTGNTGIVLSSETVRFEAAAGEESVYVAASGAWTVSVPEGDEWCSVEPAAGEGDGMFTVKVAENTTTQLRQTMISVSCADGGEDSVIVKQEGVDEELFGNPGGSIGSVDVVDVEW